MLQEVVNKLKPLIENKNMEANLVSAHIKSLMSGSLMHDNFEEFKTTLSNLNLAAKPSRDEIEIFLNKLLNSQLYTLAAVINAGKDGFDLGTTFDPVNEAVALAESQFHSREAIINSIVENPDVIDDFESGMKWMPDGLRIDDVLKSVEGKLY